jgi:hypothetical protein
MKKLIALIAVCGFAFAFVACGAKKTDEAAATDSTTVVETPAPAATDSASTDSTATDSTAHQ